MLRRYLATLLDKLRSREELVLMVLAVIVGAGTGLAAVIFIRLISFINWFAYGELGAFFPQWGRIWFIVIPVIGALAGGPIIAYFATEAKGHGVPEVMQALIQCGGRIRPRVALAKIVASALCIGTGGSAGREGPVVQVGSTLGSSVGQWLRLSDERIKNLVACGAAAGIAATFNAPIAGVLFATEILMSEFQVTVFGNVMLASVSASIVSQVFLGARPAFEIPTYVLHSPWEILLYVLLGLLAALVGVGFIRLLDSMETMFDSWRFPAYAKPAVGGLLLGLLAYVYPHVTSLVSVYGSETRLGLPLIDNIPHIYGSGFAFLDHVLQGSAPFWLLVILIFLKPLATAFTLGSGNSGGVFAPSLFTGAVLGGAFGHVCQEFFPAMGIEVGAYALVGMAAVFAAAARAPLTSILIVFEMSNDYRLILPLMAASMVASSVAQWLQPESIYTIKLAKRGIRFGLGRDLDVMQGVRVEEMMNRNPVTVEKDQSVAELFAMFQETNLRGFPVTAGDELYGIVTLQDMERTIAKMEHTLHRKDVSLKDLRVWDVATPDPITVFPDQPIWAAIRKMSPRDLERLPVVSRDNPRRLLGLISRSDILRAYDVGLMRKRRDPAIREQMALRRIADVELVEVTVAEGDPGQDLTLAEIPLPAGANLVTIQRDDAVLVPTRDTKIMAGDHLSIFCRPDLVDQVRGLFTNNYRDEKK
ncbi:MAG: chloride channel protein [Desulfobacterales bacterium]|nr:chloride channel protein [Desulfobacterales bacterium]